MDETQIIGLRQCGWWIINHVHKIWDDQRDELNKWREEDPDTYDAFIMDYSKP